LINNDTPVWIKTTHSNMLNASSMLNNSPIFVTNQDLDESTDSDYDLLNMKRETVIPLKKNKK